MSRGTGAPRPALRRSLFAPVAALGIGLMLAGCGAGAAPPTFDLSAPNDFGRLAAGRGQLAVGEPTAIQALDSDRVLVKSGENISFVGGAQWAARLPSLVQARLIDTFQNGGRLTRVSRPTAGFVADYLLSSEIRAFQIDSATRTAVVEISARMLTPNGQAVGGKLFSAQVPLAGPIDGPNATRALNEALGQVLVQMARWASAGGR